MVTGIDSNGKKFEQLLGSNELIPDVANQSMQ